MCNQTSDEEQRGKQERNSQAELEISLEVSSECDDSSEHSSEDDVESCHDVTPEERNASLRLRREVPRRGDRGRLSFEKEGDESSPPSTSAMLRPLPPINGEKSLFTALIPKPPARPSHRRRYPHRSTFPSHTPAAN